MQKLFLILLMSHLVADFYLQTNSMCEDKDKNGFISPKLYLHLIIVIVCSWLVLPSVSFIKGALFIGISHFMMDGIKHYINKCKWVFFADQLFHIAMLMLVSYFYKERAVELLGFWGWNIRCVIYIVGILFICKPTNILIQNIFNVFDIHLNNSGNNQNQSLPQAGHIIGITERIMTYLFVILGQYEALGFLIAAKSILRFSDNDTSRTEYVLVGTLLSFMIAIITAFGVSLLVK